MPKYAVTINGHTYEVESDHELSDSDAHQAALSQLSTSRDTETTAPSGPKPQPISADEPSTYAGGFWKGLKDYGKDLVSDPRTMGMVGATAASYALAPETGGLSMLAVPFLGAAGGAGVAHTIKQLRTGEPEDATDVAGSMATEGGINAALAAVPGAARWAGPKLTARAARLAAQPDAARLTRHIAAGTATAMGHPSIGAMIEAIQSPTVNRLTGEGLNAIGTIPEVAGRMGRRLMGDEAPAVVDALTPNRSGYRSGAPFSHVPEAPGEAMPATRPPAPNYADFRPGRSTAYDAEFGPSIPNESGYVPGEEVPDAPGSISALERQMMAKPQPEPWPQSPSRSSLKFGETEQPQALPFDESRGSGSLDALDAAMSGYKPGKAAQAAASGAAPGPRYDQLSAPARSTFDKLGEQSAKITDALSGLKNLGYTGADAMDAVKRAAANAGYGADTPQLLKLALAELAR